MSAPLAFIDTETTGLDAERHEIWEIGLIVDDVEYQWFLDINEAKADPFALSIGQYDKRHPHGREYEADDDHPVICRSGSWIYHEVAKLTHGRHLVGAVVSFDEERLRRAMVKERIRPSWHYHLVDVEALAAGQLMFKAREVAPRGTTGAKYAADWRGAASPPWNSEALSRAMGINPDHFDRHTALGDARWAKAIYEQVMGA